MIELDWVLRRASTQRLWMESRILTVNLNNRPLFSQISDRDHIVRGLHKVSVAPQGLRIALTLEPAQTDTDSIEAGLRFVFSHELGHILSMIAGVHGF